jgi:hypothetical protein
MPDNSNSATTREALWQLMYQTQLADISKLLGSNKQRHSLGALNAVFAQDDHFIRPRYVREFAAQLRGLLPATTSSPFTWIGGGHATAMLFRAHYQKAAIVAALQDLDTTAE